MAESQCRGCEANAYRLKALEDKVKEHSDFLGDQRELNTRFKMQDKMINQLLAELRDQMKAPRQLIQNTLMTAIISGGVALLYSILF